MKTPRRQQAGVVDPRDDDPEVPNQAVFVLQQLASLFPWVIAPCSEESRWYVRPLRTQYFPNLSQLPERYLVPHAWGFIKHHANVWFFYMDLSHLSHSYAQNYSNATLQEHTKFVEQGLAKGPSFTTPEEQVAWYRLKDPLLGLHIELVISTEFFQCTHWFIGRSNFSFHIIVFL